MHTIAKRILETYIRDQKILTVPELDLDEEQKKYLETKDISFVTIFKNGKVVGSSGRIHIKRDNTILELIDNTLQTIKDERFSQEIKNVEDLGNITIRVDIISNIQRKVIKNLGQIDVKTDGLILISQDYEKAGIILPNISNIAITPDDLFYLICKKSGLDQDKIKETDYILYKINSTVYSD
ncbi:MAG: AMMECR1 domain-containing protein [Candidatus Gracilibacteria bacterium]|nr:AMMECR1 domain-containing protein [Candidatus Gracilibacteria bacterium]MDD4530468.1 AMMECR1 domain-containing protein [Candidatus Gracilibacteria bacterium]